MATNVSERIHTLHEIRRIIAILAVAGVVKDTIDLNHAIKAREALDRAWHAPSCASSPNMTNSTRKARNELRGIHRTVGHR